MTLVPGSLPPAFQNAETDTPQRSLNMTVNGQDGAANTTLTDGTRNVNVGLPAPQRLHCHRPRRSSRSTSRPAAWMPKRAWRPGSPSPSSPSPAPIPSKGSAFEFFNNEEAECVAVLLRRGRRPEAPDRAADVRRNARRSDPPQSIVLLRFVRGLHRPAGAVRLLQRAERGDSQRRLQQRAQRERNAAADLRPVVWRPGHRHGPNCSSRTTSFPPTA